MKVIKNLPIKHKPSDFVVIEKGEYEFDEKGHHFLYILTKKNLTTRELSKKFGFSYAGLKDKISISVQHITFNEFKGNYFSGKLRDGFYVFKFLGKVRKKIKIGQLKGNNFFIKVDLGSFDFKEFFINYYGIQRLKGNVTKGKRVIGEVLERRKRKLTYHEHFAIDAYLSFLWNSSLSLYLKDFLDGEEIVFKGFSFFSPYSLETVYEKIPKFWPVLGYKKVLDDTVKIFYSKVIKKEGFSLDSFLEVLKLLKIKGDFRKTYLPVKCNFTNGFATFFLPKGAYATVYLTFCFKGD